MAATALATQALQTFNTGLLSGATFIAPDAVNGNVFNNDGNTLLLVNNTSGSSINITWTIPNSPYNSNGNLATTYVQACTTAHIAILGPLPKGIYNNTSGQAQFLASTATGVTVAAVQILQNPVN